jgi:Ca2+-binding EF-hand superfamily protein
MVASLHGRKFMRLRPAFSSRIHPRETIATASSGEDRYDMPIAPLVLLAAAAAQPAPAAPAAPASIGRPRRFFVSPMGEPFRARDRNDDTLADWFNQADTNHDGYLTAAEFTKDAERFFATLDVNHDGEIDPDEITHYEEVVAPEIRSGPNYTMELAAGAEEGERGGRGEGHRGGGGGGGHHFRARGGDDSHQGAGRYGLLDLPEPVVSADSDFNRGVSLNEFRQAAVQRFVALDLDHHGRLSLSELESIRPAPAAEPNKERPDPSTLGPPPED